MIKRVRTYSGSASDAVSQRETENRAVARRAAAEGMVLLKNDGLLPLERGARVALFGGGAVRTIKGGTGSGDVNEREVVSIWQGLREAGLELTDTPWLERCAEGARRAREAWRDSLYEIAEREGTGFMAAYSAHVFRMPSGDPLTAEDLGGADAAFYVISRTAGEDADRFNEPGDYTLTDREREDLSFLNAHCGHLAVVLNTGGQIDLRFILGLSNLKALISIVQPGMEGGHALADIVTGAVTPSGKLVDTWAVDYADYPNAGTFSHMNGDTDTELYLEGPYVGYRYFDSFEKPVAFPFGFGLSYTTFDMIPGTVKIHGNQINVPVTVRNTGDTWSGKEVVQVYASCPQTGLPKVRRRLVGFAKTPLLAPGESGTVTVTFSAKDLASFDESRPAWIVEAGRYGLWLGNSSDSLDLMAVLEVPETAVLEAVEHICPLQDPIQELVCTETLRLAQERAWHELAAEKGLKPIPFQPEMEKKERFAPNDAAKKATEIAEQLTEEQLIHTVMGEISKGQGQVIGAAGVMVPGAAGETTGALEADFGIPGVSMADGPAGLRLVKSYEVDNETGEMLTAGFLSALEGGFFAKQEDHPGARRYYQFATAIPVGTLLAQTWDRELLMDVGRAVAREMREFGVGLWLAPGMNIHRNPLCGRNFEYYSEDPVVSGRMAAAITRGVQSVPGTGTTIKHFACNNQEDNRMGSNSVVTERTLRELYLRGFEIAVREAQPMAIMTSYNLLNGQHTANSYGLCTEAARKEWDFRGLIMTDWCTTMDRGGSDPWRCPAAGNDLIMPGCPGDVENIRAALADGKLTVTDLRACARWVLTVVLQTLAFEDAPSYGAQFEQ